MAISWDGYEKQPAVIQICPWYLNEVSKAEFKTAKNQRTPLTGKSPPCLTNIMLRR